MSRFDLAEASQRMTKAINEMCKVADLLTDEDYQRLYALAQQYHEEAEAYDQIVCSVRNKRGVAMPKDYYELRLINQNAIKVRKRLINENPDIDQREFRKLISRFPD